MKRKLIILLGIILLIILNVKLSLASSSEVLENSETVDYSIAQDYYDSIEKIICKDGKKYELQNVEKVENFKTESKQYTYTKQRIVTINNKSSVLDLFEQTKDIDEDGFKGTVTRNDETLKITARDIYKEEYKVYWQIKYENISSNELNNISKEITRDGTTYFLVNPEWNITEVELIEGKEIPTKYSGIMNYEGIKTKDIITSYLAQIEYSGTIEKKINDTTTFTMKYKEVNSNGGNSQEENHIIPSVATGTGIILICSFFVFKFKNVKIYNLDNTGKYKLIKRIHFDEKKMLIDLTPHTHQSRTYRIVISKSLYRKLERKSIEIKYFDKQFYYNIKSREFEIFG